MDAVRTLPIRLRPVTGEALDSWLEGLARRTHSAFGDVLSAVGVDPHRGRGSNSWIVQLTDEESERISFATGVAAEVLGTMTLAHYSERALRCITQIVIAGAHADGRSGQPRHQRHDLVQLRRRVNVQDAYVQIGQQLPG